MKYAIIISMCILAFDHAKKADTAAGYKDGYAVGHHQHCQPRNVLIAGDWNNDKYTTAYHRGVKAGYTDCNNSN